MLQKKRTSINIMPSETCFSGDFLSHVKKIVNDAIVSNNYLKNLENGEFKLSWYDDEPVSQGVSVMIDYQSGIGVEVVDLLINEFKEKEIRIIGIRPY